jgi:rhodanese-related sulfurtransferase
VRIKLNFKEDLMSHLKYLIYSVIVSAAFFVSCAQDSENNTLTVGQLREIMSTDTNLIILDVRLPHKLTGNLGQIENIINIPVQELEKRISELDEYQEKNIAVICKVGVRSGKATEILIKHGFSAKNVLGGMIKYRETEKNK